MGNWVASTGLRRDNHVKKSRQHYIQLHRYIHNSSTTYTETAAENGLATIVPTLTVVVICQAPTSFFLGHHGDRIALTDDLEPGCRAASQLWQTQ